MDKDGNEISTVDVTKDYLTRLDAPNKLLVNADGDVVVVSAQMFCLYNSKLEKRGEVIVETGTDAAAVSAEGLFLCGSKDDKGNYVKVLDPEKKRWGKRYNLDLETFDQMDSLMNGGNGWDFYYRNNSGIYGYCLKDGTSQKVMDYVLSDMVAENIICIAVTDEGKIIGVFFDAEEGDKLLCYTKGDADEEKEKKVITVGVISMDVLGGEGTRLSNAVVAFNGNSDQYRIEIVDYEERQERLDADIATGKQPDILYLDDETMPIYSYIEGGVFEELTAYYDREIYQEDIVAVGYPCEDQKGSYFVPKLRLALCSASREKEGAWEFLKMFMTKEYQGKIIDEEMFVPTRWDCYGMWKERMTTTESCIDDLGQEIQPYVLSGSYEGGSVNITGIPMQDMNLFDEVVQSTTKIYHCDMAVKNIIEEEAAVYFKGDITLEETTKRIQNRVTTYVNESR